jgi:Na+/phosphate symporter
MILGMSTSTFTTLHVVLSLVGILAGFIVVFGLLGSRRFDGWTALFLATTILTSATGFLFPRDHVLPSHIVGVISLAMLAIATFALYSRRLAGSWRWIYVVGAVVALYLNVFVAVFQSFLKVPAVNALAPTQSEPPFLIAQSVVLLIFIAIAVAAVRSFHPQPGPSK